MGKLEKLKELEEYSFCGWDALFTDVIQKINEIIERINNIESKHEAQRWMS